MNIRPTPAPASGPAAIDVRDLRASFGGPDVLRGIDLRVAPGAVVALLGPSGCGKTTLLRAIAGLERPIAGEIRIGDRLISGPGTHVVPEARRVGMVFQDWALFPHLDVGRNVGYGLPRGRAGGAAARIDAALELVGLPGLAARMPATLSGGQQQRVALARAIAPQPSILLLDEPFSNLDSTLRVQVRTEVHALLVELGVTAVFVTHDQEEAFVLGDRVAVMLDGRIVQEATPAELYARPATPWLAGFVGDANLLEATASRGTARTAVGPVRVDRSMRGACTVLVRPEALTLDAKGTATVELVEYQGHDTAYVVRIDDDTTVRVRLPGPPRHSRGDAVAVSYSGAVAAAYLPG
jgi:iron(III) transport system ATP-binding protein